MSHSGMSTGLKRPVLPQGVPAPLPAPADAKRSFFLRARSAAQFWEDACHSLRELGLDPSAEGASATGSNLLESCASAEYSELPICSRSKTATTDGSMPACRRASAMRLSPESGSSVAGVASSTGASSAVGLLSSVAGVASSTGASSATGLLSSAAGAASSTGASSATGLLSSSLWPSAWCPELLPGLGPDAVPGRLPEDSNVSLLSFHISRSRSISSMMLRKLDSPCAAGFCSAGGELLLLKELSAVPANSLWPAGLVAGLT